jgi:hypothetical protein
MYVVVAGSVIGVGQLVCGVVSAVSIGGGVVAGVHTGLPGRQCGRHKMAAYLLQAADVMWLGMECPSVELERQVDVCSHP